MYPFIGPFTPVQILNDDLSDFSVPGCYVVYNLTNGLVYVGKGIDIIKRVKQHYRVSGGNSKLFLDYDHGDNIAIYFVRLSDTDFFDLQQLEGYLIRFTNAVKHGYNERYESNSDFSDVAGQYLDIVNFFDFMSEFSSDLIGWFDAQFYEHDYSDGLCYFPFALLRVLFQAWCRKNGKSCSHDSISIGLLYLWVKANDKMWKFIPDGESFCFLADLDVPFVFLGKYPVDKIMKSRSSACFSSEVLREYVSGGLFYSLS